MTDALDKEGLVKATKAANMRFRSYFPGSRMDLATAQEVTEAAITAYLSHAPRLDMERELAEARAEKPHCRIDQSDLPLWQQINAIFERHGWSTPGTRLRDELVMILAWARYGEALDAALPGASIPAPADMEKAVERLKDAVEGECDGLAIDDAQANAILDYVFTGEPPK